MTTERKHRCSGELDAREVQVVLDGSDGISMIYRVHGFVCNKCHEQLIERETAHELQASQTPTVTWHPRRPASTQLDELKFDPLTAGTAKEAVA